MFKMMENINDLPQEIIVQLEKFFINYNQESGKEFKIEKRMDAKESFKIIQENRN